MAIIVQDSFNRADSTVNLGTTDSGQLWSTEGTKGIINNQAYVNASYGGVGVVSGVSDCFVQVTFANVSDEASLIFRRVDNYVAAMITALPSGYVIRYFNFDEGWVTIGSHPVTPANGDVLRVKVVGKTADAYLNGSKIMSVSFKSLYGTAASQGLGGSGINNRFDNFLVESLTSEELPTGTAHTKSLSDSVGTSESVAKRFSGFKALTDAIPTSDSISKRFSAMVIDAIAAGDSESERTNKRLSDAITGADSLTKTKGKAVNIADSVAITDAISKALSKLRTDSIAGSDSERESTVKRFADSINISDQLIKTGGKSVLLSDYVLTSDSLAKSASKTRGEAISLADSIGKKSSVNLRLYDVVISADSLETFVPDVPAYREVIRIPLNIATGQTLTLSITQRETIELKL